MSQGRPGDHPITDILFHNAEYFNPEIRELFKEVYELSHRHLKVFDVIDLFKDSDEVVKEKLLKLRSELSS